MNKGKFITIEGIEGAGKSIQMKKIIQYLNEKGINFINTREPGGTSVSEKIRAIIVNEEIDAVTEALLFASARRDHVKKLIQPALNNGVNVISDRFVHSSIAYQGFGRNLGLAYSRAINTRVLDDCYPDKVIYLDIKPEVGLERIKINNRNTNRLDKEDIAFYKKCREGFLLLSKLEPEIFVVINADQTPEAVFNEIKDNVLVNLL